MPTPDPTDAAVDAAADGAFQPAPTSHRAGYGDAVYWALRQARKGGTLMAGEGLALVKHYEALVEEAYREGHSDGRMWKDFLDETVGWEISETRAKLEAP